MTSVDSEWVVDLYIADGGVTSEGGKGQGTGDSDFCFSVVVK